MLAEDHRFCRITTRGRLRRTDGEALPTLSRLWSEIDRERDTHAASKVAT